MYCTCHMFFIYSIDLAMASQTWNSVRFVKEITDNRMHQTGTCRKKCDSLKYEVMKTEEHVSVQTVALLCYCGRNLKVQRSVTAQLSNEISELEAKKCKKSRLKKSYWIRYSNVMSFISFLCHLSYVLSLFLIFLKCTLSCIPL